MGKKKNRLPTSKELGEAIRSDFKRWKDIFNNGCLDPAWEDGVNINCVRKHIIYDQRRVENILKDNYIAYPNEYFYPVPVQLSNKFMAVDRKLACRGKVFKANKSVNYKQAVCFDWREALCG